MSHQGLAASKLPGFSVAERSDAFEKEPRSCWFHPGMDWKVAGYIVTFQRGAEKG